MSKYSGAVHVLENFSPVSALFDGQRETEEGNSCRPQSLLLWQVRLVPPPLFRSWGGKWGAAGPTMADEGNSAGATPPANPLVNRHCKCSDNALRICRRKMSLAKTANPAGGLCTELQVQIRLTLLSPPTPPGRFSNMIPRRLIWV